MARRGAPVEERFFEKVDTKGVCWEWTKATTPKGYGVFNLGRDKGTVLTHRWSWEFLVGPIPDGLQLDHVCRNKACVNPDHLEPVTQAENLRRGGTTSGNNARKTCCPRCGGAYSIQYIHGEPYARFCEPCHREWKVTNKEKEKISV